ncbi:hypothetical protein AAFF_G00171290 [Aldrovandia affinis]|uniref:Uncharacterized protein n=1 Tax=Aldrovandia affinis TaxID=143900 RepID=A0AAD7R0V7_9TELE|nr:hypothetical protein AAFF_G00171290 [Aldrovandia affinis]
MSAALYFEQSGWGLSTGVALSKELLCRLIRNTMTNMISIARATEDSRYPSKHEVNAMAKRLVEYYPMIKDRSSSSNTEWVLDELRRIIQPTNSQYISEMKDRWEIFYSKWSMLQLCSEPCHCSSHPAPCHLESWAQTARLFSMSLRLQKTLMVSCTNDPCLVQLWSFLKTTA